MSEACLTGDRGEKGVSPWRLRSDLRRRQKLSEAPSAQERPQVPLSRLSKMTLASMKAKMWGKGKDDTMIELDNDADGGEGGGVLEAAGAENKSMCKSL